MSSGVVAISVVAFLAAAAPRIHDIQGARHISPWVDRDVEEVEGVVTQMASGGFYMQDAAPDANEATSEGIRVSAPATVAMGDVVRVSGVVREVRPGCDPCSPADEAFANLTTTEIVATMVAVVGHTDELPEPTPIGSSPGARFPPSAVVESDGAGDVERDEISFDPPSDGLDFYESVEGMRVRVDAAQVVGPTAHFSDRAAEVVVVPNRGLGFGPFSRAGGLLRGPTDENPERIFVTAGAGARLPDLDVGDAFSGPVVGVIDYSFGNFKLVVSGSFAGLAPRRVDTADELSPPSAHELTVATLNVRNLGPASPAIKFDRLAELIGRNLAAPDVVVLQEIQDDSGTSDDGTTGARLTYALLLEAISRRGGPPYAACDVAPNDGQDGGAPGANIRVGFLIRQDGGVALIDRPGAGPDTLNVVRDLDGAAELGFSPGRVEPTSDVFAQSRKPVALELELEGSKLFLVGVHLSSRIGDGPVFGRFQPPHRPTEARRVAQAGVLSRFVERIFDIDPAAGILVAGDFNDAAWSPSLATLARAGLRNLLEPMPPAQRYTYDFQGNSDAIDHILASPSMVSELVDVAIVHASVDFAAGVTDHDPVVARFAMRSRAAWPRFGCGCELARTSSSSRPLAVAVLPMLLLSGVRRQRRELRHRRFLCGRCLSSKNRRP